MLSKIIKFIAGCLILIPVIGAAIFFILIVHYAAFATEGPWSKIIMVLFDMLIGGMFLDLLADKLEEKGK